MIITKERLKNSYIKNDKGLLREKFAELAKSYGIPIDEPLDWFDFPIVYIGKTGGGVLATIHTAPSGLRELTLEDFIQEIIMVTPDWVSVIQKYNNMCEKPFTKKQVQNMLTYRKRNNLLEEWLELKIAYNMWVVNNDWKKGQ